MLSTHIRAPSALLVLLQLSVIAPSLSFQPGNECLVPSGPALFQEEDEKDDHEDEDDGAENEYHHRYGAGRFVLVAGEEGVQGGHDGCFGWV